MNFRRTLLVASFLFASATVSAGEKPGDATAFLVKQMGGTELSLKGHTPEMYFACGVDFRVEDGNLRAYFFHPSGSQKDIRGLFEIKAKTKVKLLDVKKSIVIVENDYVVTENGRSKKTTYRAQMEVALDNAGKVMSVNIGWNRDRMAPLMYRCVMN